jgi:hypothetical protein
MENSGQLLEIASQDELKTDGVLPPLIIGDHLSSLTILQLCTDRGVRHVVQRSNLKPQSETNLAKFMMDHPAEFIKFPISAILGVPNPSVETELKVVDFKVQIDSPNSKLGLEEDLKDYARKFKNPSSVIYDISIAADELITNALYNAPYVDDQNSTSGPARDPNSIVIDPNKRPELFAGSDGARFVVGVRDYYGRLNTCNLIKRIQGCYETNVREQISYKEGGAGIGSYMIFDSCAGMYIAVEKNRSTTICCSFPVGMTARKRSVIPKNIHILNIQEVGSYS